MSFKRETMGGYMPEPENFKAWEHKFSPAVGDYLENEWKGETSRARERRLREGWFDKYCPADKVGLDIGSSYDSVHMTFRRMDMEFGDGDAQFMYNFEPEMFWTVYASHVLEHMKHPMLAVRRWYELVRPGGHLVLVVPHRDLYEKRKMLPSQWNPDHKYFWLPDEEEPPCTKSMKATILEAIPNADIVDFRVIDEGYNHDIAPDQHPVGEYSIEAVIKKP